MIYVLAILGLALACAAWGLLMARGGGEVAGRKPGGCGGGCGGSDCDSQRNER